MSVHLRPTPRTLTRVSAATLTVPHQLPRQLLHYPCLLYFCPLIRLLRLLLTTCFYSPPSPFASDSVLRVPLQTCHSRLNFIRSSRSQTPINSHPTTSSARHALLCHRDRYERLPLRLQPGQSIQSRKLFFSSPAIVPRLLTNTLASRNSLISTIHLTASRNITPALSLRLPTTTHTSQCPSTTQVG